MGNDHFQRLCPALLPMQRHSHNHRPQLLLNALRLVCSATSQSHQIFLITWRQRGQVKREQSGLQVDLVKCLTVLRQRSVGVHWCCRGSRVSTLRGGGGGR